MSATAGTPLLEIDGLGKTFPGLRALDGVSLRVERGEIVALLGQNGSGKSTLVKVLADVHQPDDGSEIRIDGVPVDELGRERNERLHFIHQDLGLIMSLSAIENLDVGRSMRGRAWRPIHMRREAEEAARLLARFGARIPLEVPVAELSAAERTIVAIARALDGWRQPDNVLVLDEPTAALHGEEVNALFDAVRTVARGGAGIVFVSHRLEEVLDLADRVVVLRDGKVVLSQACAETDARQLAHAVAGRAVNEARIGAGAGAGDSVLEVRGVRGRTVRRADLAVRAGEIVGITGLVGSGSEHLLGLLFGAHERSGGSVRVDGEELPADRPWSAVRHGVAFVPAERKRFGGVMSMSVRENLTLTELGTLCTRSGRLDGRMERREVARWMQSIDLRPREPEMTFELLSGGNQQKVVIAKCLRTNPRVLLMDEPTQGVDVGAKLAIHELVGEAATRGMAVVVASSDTKELVMLCQRVLVFRDGRVSGEVATAALNEARLVREALGVHGEEPHELQLQDGR